MRIWELWEFDSMPTKSVELYRERPFRWCFGEAHWSERCHIRPFSAYTFLLLTRINGKHLMKGHSRHNASLIGRKNQSKFKNDCLSWNGYRINITQPNSMILVSFSSAEDALFNDVREYDTFRSQGTENPPFHFLGDTQYSALPKGTTAMASRLEPMTSRLWIH